MAEARSDQWTGTVALVATLVGLVLAAPVIAADATRNAEAQSSEQVVIVKTVRRHPDGTVEEEESQTGTLPADRKCDGKTIETTSEQPGSNGKVERSRIILCMHGDDSAVASHLAEARERIAADTEMGAEARDRALAAIDAEIARLKARSASPYSRQ